jgi:MoaA/NifB/PqqE/SkfB family radical SAM enzyme
LSSVVGDSLANCRSASAWLADRARACGALLTLHVELTSRCPLRCGHCYNDKAVPDSLDLATLERVLDEASTLGCLFAVFTGGEVYARPDFEEVIALARRRSFDVRFQTSGWYLDERAAAVLADLAVSEVHLSCYSADSAVHDTVTGVAGSHMRTLRAVRALRAAGVRVLLKNVLTRINAESYRSVPSLAAEMGCICTTDATVVPCESGHDCGPCAMRAPDSALRDFYGDYAWGLVSAAFRTPAEAGARQALDHRPCLAGTDSLFLASDGNVFPCVDLRIPCGSVFGQSLQDIWRNSAGLRQVRDLRWRDLPACACCELRAFCNHCIAVSQNEHGDLFGPALENCRHAVIRRDLLRERGLIPASETALPPPMAVGDIG